MLSPRSELSEALRADLRNKIRERLRLWLKDSMSLYNMADVPKLHAIEDILYVLLSFTLNGIDALGLDPKHTSKFIEETLISIRKQGQKAKHTKSTKEEST